MSAKGRPEREYRSAEREGTPVSARPIAPFLLRVAIWLLVMFFLWWLATPVLTWPVAGLAELISRLVLSDVVRSVEQHGEIVTFVTSLRPPGALPGARAVLEVPSNVRLFSFGLPMLAALTLATREPGALRKLAIGYAVLVPVQAFSVVVDFLKNLTDDPAAMAQLGWAPWHRELIAFCYQFGTLILPTVAPAIVWVLMHRRFLENFAGGRVA